MLIKIYKYICETHNRIIVISNQSNNYNNNSGYYSFRSLVQMIKIMIIRFILFILKLIIMELKKFWKYLAIGMIVAVVFGITLNVGWETVFINLVLGFGTAIGKGMRKDYEMKYAFLNYSIPMLIAGIITAVCISLSIA